MIVHLQMISYELMVLGDGEEGVVEQDMWLEQEPEGQEAEVLGDRLT